MRFDCWFHRAVELSSFSRRVNPVTGLKEGKKRRERGLSYPTPDPDLFDGVESRTNSPSVNIIGYAKFYSRSHDAVIRVFDEAGNVIDTHEHAGEFKEF